jgi:hypothetical protein
MTGRSMERLRRRHHHELRRRLPVFPRKRYLDWQFDGPVGKTIDQVRPIRDEIDSCVRALLTELI